MNANGGQKYGTPEFALIRGLTEVTFLFLLFSRLSAIPWTAILNRVVQ
jgi:hypothetical protein